MKRFLSIVLALCMVFALCACGNDSNNGGSDADSSKYDKISIDLSCNGQSDTANDCIGANLFKQYIEEQSGGAITVTIYNNDQLAGGEFVSSVLAEHGLTYLGALHNGFKCMTSSKCQIKAPSDLVGQKIRTPGGDLWNGFWSALGASPQAMSWSEVYTAMQQKTIDGHDNSPSTINSANVQEVQKYITVSNHTYEAFTWSANSDWYNGLNEATQELIASCAKQACLDANKQIEDSMEKILSNWEGNGYNEIYRLSDSEIEVFKEAVASVTEQYANEYGQEACTAFGINVAS